MRDRVTPALSLTLGALAAVAVWFILPTLWYGCDAEPPGGGYHFARGFLLIMVAPAVFVVTTVVGAGAMMLVTRARPSWPPRAAVGGQLTVPRPFPGTEPNPAEPGAASPSVQQVCAYGIECALRAATRRWSSP